MIEFRFNKQEFELAFRKYMEEGGHSYDPSDIEYHWSDYCKDPSKFDYLP